MIQQIQRKAWRCTICGEVFEDKPKECDACKAKKDFAETIRLTKEVIGAIITKTIYSPSTSMQYSDSLDVETDKSISFAIPINSLYRLKKRVTNNATVS